VEKKEDGLNQRRRTIMNKRIFSWDDYKKELLKQMEKEYEKIIEEYGYSEMSDGFDKAMDIVENYKGGIIKWEN
jgi:AAA15 family ATPase/GTPase